MTSVPTWNGGSVPEAELPPLPTERFFTALKEAVADGARVCSLFALPAEDGALCLTAVLAFDEDGELAIFRSEKGVSAWPSLTPSCPQVHLFERELAETGGLGPEGQPWLKPVRVAPPRRETGKPRRAAGVSEAYQVDGEEVHEVGVGPVHAGVIEPGHFRFQCHGEEVMHLELTLGYQHRGGE